MLWKQFPKVQGAWILAHAIVDTLREPLIALGEQRSDWDAGTCAQFRRWGAKSKGKRILAVVPVPSALVMAIVPPI
jgi:hypothetical protein